MTLDELYVRRQRAADCDHAADCDCHCDPAADCDCHHPTTDELYERDRRMLREHLGERYAYQEVRDIVTVLDESADYPAECPDALAWVASTLRQLWCFLEEHEEREERLGADMWYSDDRAASYTPRDQEDAPWRVCRCERQRAMREAEVWDPEPLAYRRADAATQLGVSVDTLDRLIADGQIRSTKARRATVITRWELGRFLAKQQA